MNTEKPSTQVWVTLLATGGVILGTLTDIFLVRNPDSAFQRPFFMGLAGSILGFVAGHAFIAWNCFTPRRTPKVPLLAGDLAGDSPDGAATNKPPVHRPDSTLSSGQRWFAFVAWSSVGIVLMAGSNYGACYFLDSVYDSFLPEPDLTPVREWEARYGGRPLPMPMPGEVTPSNRPPEEIPERPDTSEFDEWNVRRHEKLTLAGTIGEVAAGVILLIIISLFWSREYRRLRDDLSFGRAMGCEVIVGGFPPGIRTRWGAISLTAFMIGLLVAAGAIVSTYNPLRSSPFPTTGFQISGGFHAIGLFAAMIANKSDERWYLLTILGLILNVLVLALLALAFLDF